MTTAERPACEAPAPESQQIRGVAVGEDGRTILRLETEGWWKAARQTAGGQEVINDLLDMYTTTRRPGWDGYDAKAISDATFKRAVLFLQSMPRTVPTPDLVPEPTGTIAFEWQQAQNLVFSVSVQAGYPVAYAGLFGMNRVFGTELFIDEFPRSLLPHIGRIFPDEVQRRSA